MKDLNIWNWRLYGTPLWMSRAYLVIMSTILIGGFTLVWLLR